MATTTNNDFKLFCWVLGTSINPFPVNISKSETVGDLKEAIKSKMELHGPASDLTLWKVSDECKLISTTDIYQVSVPADRNLKKEVDKLALNDEESLLPTDELSEVFEESPARKHLHIVARGPPIGKFQMTHVSSFNSHARHLSTTTSCCNPLSNPLVYLSFTPLVSLTMPFPRCRPDDFHAHHPQHQLSAKVSVLANRETLESFDAYV
jgi:hypothetical protein